MTSKSQATVDEFEYPSHEVVTCPYPFYRRCVSSPRSSASSGDYLVSRWDDLVLRRQVIRSCSPTRSVTSTPGLTRRPRPAPPRRAER